MVSAEGEVARTKVLTSDEWADAQVTVVQELRWAGGPSIEYYEAGAVLVGLGFVVEDDEPEEVFQMRVRDGEPVFVRCELGSQDTDIEEEES